MRPAYFLAIAVILVVLGMLLYPALHGYISTVSTVGFLPLLAAAVAFLPYAFLGFVVYAIIKKRQGG